VSGGVYQVQLVTCEKNGISQFIHTLDLFQNLKRGKMYLTSWILQSIPVNQNLTRFTTNLSTAEM
jgi:hypothetical protein